MPEQTTTPNKICPYLGLIEDQTSRFSFPEQAHRCFANDQEGIIPLDHQSSFCLTAEFQACPRFIKTPIETNNPESDSKSKGLNPAYVVLWGLLGLFVGALIIFGLGSSTTFAILPEDRSAIVIVPTASLTPTGTATTVRVVQNNSPTPSPLTFFATPTSTATPAEGVELISLSADSQDSGWFVSGEGRGNHFGDSYLYVGIYDGQIYTSGFQFDLSPIPRGAPIYSASLILTGLREDQLALHNDLTAAGTWSARMLAADVDSTWRRLNYQDIYNAAVDQTLHPILGDRELASGQTNVFDLSPVQVKTLEERIINEELPQISFRLDGPVVGPNNLFAWDTGYGPESRGNGISLVLNVGEPPETLPPFDYVVVTSTPTPENVITAAAVAVKATTDAPIIGTATPAPSNMVTATPFPEWLVIVPTTTPENEVTAQALLDLATAQAMTTGTATPQAPEAVTATPIPTETSTPTPLPTATPDYVLITSTPTAETIFEAATAVSNATARAVQVGTATPLPTNWVTPIVVTDTPTPANQATTQYISDLATAVVVTTGTPTPVAGNVVTATPTPIFELIPLLLTPTPTVLPTATPQTLPSELIGKILFRSDREGDENDLVYLYDPVTGDLARLTNDWPYQVAQQRDAFSADTLYRTYTKELLYTNVEDNSGNRQATKELAIHIYNYEYKQEEVITKMGAGIAYDPVWSPVNDQIAFVATETGNDEIWLTNRSGDQMLQLTRNDWEWDKSPSWSPDGSKIVFASNRTGNQQIWIMNADGSDQQLLLGWDNWTPYNDWAPVWVKYLEPAPPEDQERIAR